MIRISAEQHLAGLVRLHKMASNAARVGDKQTLVRAREAFRTLRHQLHKRMFLPPTIVDNMIRDALVAATLPKTSPAIRNPFPLGKLR